MFDYFFIQLDGLELTEEEKKEIESERFNTFQTKDFDKELTEVYVKEEGQIYINRWELEETPKEERPFPDAEEGTIQALCGCLRRINERLEPSRMSGFINFCAGLGNPNNETWKFIEFQAEVKSGKIINVVRLKKV